MTRICVEQVTPKLTVYSLRETPEATRRSTPLAFREGPGALPTLQLRAQIADAVHEVIVSDRGAMTGLCQLYAMTGAMVAMALTKVEYAAQYGSLFIDLDNGLDENTFAFDSSDGGLRRGEFHAWMAARHRDGRIEVVDLASRLYAGYVSATLPGTRCPPQPPYIWSWSTELPKGVVLVTNPQVCLDAMADQRKYKTQCAAAAVLAREAIRKIDSGQSHPAARQHAKVGRNESCPCGSGKKFKRCCLAGMSDAGRSS